MDIFFQRWVMYRPANDPGPQMIPVPQMIPKIGPQMIPRPEMIPANGVAKIENGVDSMNSLWMYIFFNCGK